MSRPPFVCLQCIDIFQILFKLFSLNQPFCSYPNNKSTVRVAGYLSQLICPNSKVGSRLFNRQLAFSQIGTACFSISSTPFCKSQKKSSGRRLARPLRETYSPSYWHFPQPATDWLPLGSRPKRRIMINEYGSWPPSRHSSSAHSIRLPLVLPSLCGIMAWSACAALHTRNVPAAEYEAQYACLSRCNRMPSWKTISSSPHSPFSAGSFATKEQPHAAGRRRAVPIHWSNIVRLSSMSSRSC